MFIYEITELYKVYGKNKIANENINLKVSDGEILALLGPNGAGKTTLVKQMVGHLKPTSGLINFRGESVANNTKRIAQNVGYYAQETASLTVLTVKEAIYFTSRLKGLKTREAQLQTNYWLERLDLQEVMNKQIKRISGGQKRLATLACTMVTHPSVLILDEPTNELDPKNRKLVWDILREQSQTYGTSIILVTHNLLEAEQVVNRVGLIEKGKLIALDSLSGLKKKVDVRLKLLLKLNNPAQLEHLKSILPIKTNEKVTKLNDNGISIFIERHEAENILNFLAQNLESYGIEEIKLAPLSLEEVYFSKQLRSEQG